MKIKIETKMRAMQFYVIYNVQHYTNARAQQCKSTAVKKGKQQLY